MWTHPIARPALLVVVIKLAVVFAAAWFVVAPLRQRVTAPDAEARLLTDAPSNAPRSQQ